MGKLDRKTRELMTLTSEECGELVQACMKIARYGLEKHRVAALLEEVGDVQCLIDLLVKHDIVSEKGIKRRVKFKHKKLKRWSTLYD
tara:strand:- start:1567 stop:1827 length:261 start_codon:yes stop_codon:yes gene_type:complete